LTKHSATERAVDWLLQIQDGPLDAGDRAALEAWLAEHANAHAFVRVQRTWAAVDQIAGDPVIAAERARVVRRAGGAQRWRPFAAAASVAAVLCLALGLALTQPWAGRHRRGAETADADGELIGTRVGERSSVTLADGSVITLNTDSLLRVAYSDDERRIVLERGEAYFRVARHQPQPFAVYAGNQRVVATGTEFDIRLDPLRTQVVLVEGQVHVRPKANASAPLVVMQPGQKLVARAGAAPVLSAAELDQATSWTSGRLIFRDMPLREAADEINRYSERKIVLADAATGALPVNGVFFTGQPARFARALVEVQPLTLREDPDGGTIVLAKRP
jgi:transmembrane sensor